ncbi:hypothetical protein B0H16DRAFT_590913 [Mycena metata]|uniref:Uncharacterized protein n=1 Tax=Mycena metata TaxID=1033252 RepID=A0AAD7H440_9AGAR|nr:hypothetical protein B0H16DRAFT_590913 [Mycena metata]
MQRSFIVLLCLGLVRAMLQTYTVDVTSPDIHYAGDVIQCHANSCSPRFIVEGAFNDSEAITTGSITFSFTGTAIYASVILINGSCSIILDGYEIHSFNETAAEGIGGVGGGNLSQSDLADGLHTLVIDPTTEASLMLFYNLLYTASVPPAKKSHVGAIVAGVIGGVVLTIAALFMALFARRRKLITRRNQRKSTLLRAITSARHDRKGGDESATELPT